MRKRVTAEDVRLIRLMIAERRRLKREIKERQEQLKQLLTKVIAHKMDLPLRTVERISCRETYKKVGV